MGHRAADDELGLGATPPPRPHGRRRFAACFSPAHDRESGGRRRPRRLGRPAAALDALALLGLTPRQNSESCFRAPDSVVEVRAPRRSAASRRRSASAAASRSARSRAARSARRRARARCASRRRSRPGPRPRPACAPPSRAAAWSACRIRAACGAPCGRPARRRAARRADRRRTPRTKSSTGWSWKTRSRSSRWKRRATTAPVAPHRFEADDLELSRAVRHQAGVALLAAGRAAAHLGQEEARVDLLELELEVAGAAELARRAPAATASPISPRSASAAAAARAASGSPSVDEQRVGVAVDDAMAHATLDGRAARRITCCPRRVIAFATAGEKRRDAGEPSTPKSEFMRILIACDAHRVARRARARARSSQSRATSAGRMPGSSRAEGRAARRADRPAPAPARRRRSADRC